MPIGHANRLMPALRRAVLVRESAERSDGELLSAFVIDRDADAFAVLVRRHGPMVLGVCRRVVGDAHAADDAFQAVFLVLARRASAVQPRELVGSWLHGVAYRTAMKARAVLARRRAREKQVDAMPEPTVASATDSWTDLQPVIDEELARLPDKLRLPVVLCDLEGRPQRAVAKQLGIAPSTLAARLASARRLLAQRLGRRGIALSGGALATVLAERASAAVVAPTLAEGTVLAAEAIAFGAGIQGLVSAHAIQLYEGVMRMMLMTKIKTSCVCALAALLVTGGLGFGLTPVIGGENEKPGIATSAQAASDSPRISQKTPKGFSDDETFLRRVFLDLTGTLPTALETALFVTDRDPTKRTKVVDWLLVDERVKVAIARRLGLAHGAIRLVPESGEGNTIRLKVVTEHAADPERLTTAIRVARHDDVKDAVMLFLNRDEDPRQQPRAGYYRIDRKTHTERPDFSFETVDLYGLVEVDSTKPRVTLRKPDDLLIADDLRTTGERGWMLDLVSPVKESDEAFLRRVTESARGSAPTPLEFKYFAEDKDPKKRERLLDLMLRDPAIAKRVGDEWKKKMLEVPKNLTLSDFHFQIVPTTELFRLYRHEEIVPFELVERSDRFEKLVGELIQAKKSDEQILEALTLAALRRMPTIEEKRAALAVIGIVSDKRAGWTALARSLSGAEEKKGNVRVKPVENRK